MMTLSMFACPGYGEPFEKRAEAVAASGFDGIALSFEKDIAHLETSPVNQLRVAEALHLPVTQVHLTGEGMNAIWLDGESGDKMRDRTVEELHLLKDLGLSLGVIHVTWGLERPRNAPNEKGLSRFASIAEEAEKLGVTVALENSVFSDCVAYLLDRIDAPHLGLCFDSGHANAFTPEYDYFEKYAARLKAMHLHDNDGTRDAHSVPFDGKVDWQKVCRSLALTEAGRGGLTLECAKCTDEPLAVFAKRAYAAAVRLRDMIKETT